MTQHDQKDAVQILARANGAGDLVQQGEAGELLQQPRLSELMLSHFLFKCRGAALEFRVEPGILVGDSQLCR